MLIEITVMVWSGHEVLNALKKMSLKALPSLKEHSYHTRVGVDKDALIAGVAICIVLLPRWMIHKGMFNGIT